jgi:fermentation-respiration switch protein FrsA (DUF1100 family)
MQLVLWVIGVYVAVCLAGYAFHRSFIYFPYPERVPLIEAGLEDTQEIEIETLDGVRLVAWYAPAKQGKPTILYFHGNAGNAAARVEKIETMRTGGNGVFYLNNRGYGGSAGKPAEAANVADAVAAYDYLVDRGVGADQIVAYGESLGSGQAVQLAAKRKLRAVVLEAPLASTVDVGRATYWFLPLGLILTDQFRNVDQIKQVKVPVLVVHGENDEVIPLSHGKRIYGAANEPKRLEVVPGAAHNDLFEHGAWTRVQGFLDEIPTG